MIPIRPIGCFFPQDEKGNILNPCHSKFISAYYRSFFDAFILLAKERLGDNYHSCWLRGSLPRGLFQEGISDIDLFILVKTKKYFKSRQVHYHSNLQQQYPEIKNVDIIEYGYTSKLGVAYPQLAMVIKTQALCLDGIAIGHELPNYKIGKAMMLQSRWLEDDLTKFLALMDYSSSELKAICKIILRSGFELVMEREMKYTNDLYICYVSFSKYYPDLSKEMRKALFWYLNPVSKNEMAKKTIEKLGNCLCQELQSLLL
ncbi:MAG: nucleotidyltransferase domain-containing protein [Saprospiraceae bacterium]|nr:nucleotidyltransferase domain-containing protein [Saprospiraceae bacterium]